MNLTRLDVLYIAQAGECCYCGKIMCPRGGLGVSRFASLYGITKGQARHRQATTEHLVRRCEGGTSARHNIAAACNLCNSKRQDKNWVEYASERQRSPLLRKLRLAAPYNERGILSPDTETQETSE